MRKESTDRANSLLLARQIFRLSSILCCAETWMPMKIKTIAKFILFNPGYFFNLI